VGSPTPGAADVHVWYRHTTSLGAEALQAADRHLSLDEQARRDRFRFAADRRDFAVAHDLLRRKLSMYRDISPRMWQFVADRYGKPRIDNRDPHARTLTFSLAHTRGCVSCAIVSSAPVGIDVERVDRPLSFTELGDRLFSPDEAASLRRCSNGMRATRFVELWTLKEAFLKAVGVGLSGSLDSVSFRLDEPARIAAGGPAVVEDPEWHFALFEPHGDLRLAVAVRSVVPPAFYVREDGEEGAPLDAIRASG
jgi:4'-phosphopantetheinyl transferase